MTEKVFDILYQSFLNNWHKIKSTKRKQNELLNNYEEDLWFFQNALNEESFPKDERECAKGFFKITEEKGVILSKIIENLKKTN